MRRNSLEIVDGARPSWRAMTERLRLAPSGWRSLRAPRNDRYRPDNGARNQSRAYRHDAEPPPTNGLRHADRRSGLLARDPFCDLTPELALDLPAMRRPPGDFIGDRPVKSLIHPAGRPITTSIIEVLRRPVESALAAAVTVEDDPGGLTAASSGGHLERVGDELGAHVVGHRVAEQATRTEIEHRRDVQPSFTGRGRR